MTDRDRIERAARESGWSQENDGPRTTAFIRGHRAVNVIWDRETGTYPIQALHGRKRLSSIRLTHGIIATLKKD